MTEEVKYSKRNAPYKQLSGKMEERYLRRIPAISSVIAGILLGSVNLISGIISNKPIQENIFPSISIMVLFIFALLSLIVGLQNIFQSGYEDELLDAGIQYLKKQKYSEEIIQIIEKRAEIGIAAGETRTLVPIVFFTIITPVIVIIKLPIDYFTYLFTVCVTVLLLFILEVDKSNLDAVVLQSCFIYRIEEGMDKRNKSKRRRIQNK